MVKQVFIGGTGRSGTTVLGRILYEHKDIFIYPFETRFIVDPNGVIDLCDNLSEKWTPHRADFYIRKFRYFMESLYPSMLSYILKFGISFLIKKYFKKFISPFRYTTTIAGHWKDELYYTLFKPPFSIFIDKKFYFKVIDDFIDEISEREMKGFWAGSESLKIKPKLYVTKRYDKDEIYKIAGRFVDKLMSYPLKKYNKKIWGEHTPTNLLFAEQLLEMFPEAKIIHIYRDFRDVICSYKTKSWGAEITEDAVIYIKNILDKWDNTKRKISKDKYIEISLEDLVRNTQEVLEKVCEFLDIEYDKNMLKIDLSKSHSGRWKKELNEKDLNFVMEKLGDYLEKYGYI